MRNYKWRLKPCERIISIVILLSFLKFPVSAEPPTKRPPISTENLTGYYSDSEIEILIEEITEAAHEAIEQAASEAAKAAMLESLERETAALREVQRLRLEKENAKKAGFRNTVITGVICLFSGLATGSIITGVMK